ncbi:hypothetical protein B0T17DRAFT_535272, partial [Bombardia bombarda]
CGTRGGGAALRLIPGVLQGDNGTGKGGWHPSWTWRGGGTWNPVGGGRDAGSKAPAAGDSDSGL